MPSYAHTQNIDKAIENTQIFMDALQKMWQHSNLYENGILELPIVLTRLKDNQNKLRKMRRIRGNKRADVKFLPRILKGIKAYTINILRKEISLLLLKIDFAISQNTDISMAKQSGSDKSLEAMRNKLARLNRDLIRLNDDEKEFHIKTVCGILDGISQTTRKFNNLFPIPSKAERLKKAKQLLLLKQIRQELFSKHKEYKTKGRNRFFPINKKRLRTITKVDNLVREINSNPKYTLEKKIRLIVILLEKHKESVTNDHKKHGFAAKYLRGSFKTTSRLASIYDTVLENAKQSNIDIKSEFSLRS